MKTCRFLWMVGLGITSMAVLILLLKYFDVLEISMPIGFVLGCLWSKIYDVVMESEGVAHAS